MSVKLCGSRQKGIYFKREKGHLLREIDSFKQVTLIVIFATGFFDNFGDEGNFN